MSSDKIIIFPLNLDAMLRACVPGGSNCDPQKVSDAIREFVAASEAGIPPIASPCIDVRVAEELRKRLQPGEKVIWRDAFRWKDDNGALSNHYEQASVASLAAEFGYTVILDAGCAAIIRDPKTFTVPNDASKDGQPRLFAKGVEAIQGAVSSEPPAADIPADWVAFVRMCEDFRGLMVEGNDLSRKAKKLLDSAAAAPKPEGDRPGYREALAIQMLVDAGFVTAAKANEALQIAFGGLAGPLKPVVGRSWWKDVKPETDLGEANNVIDSMLNDWQKVGEALGFKNFADPENIIYRVRELSKGAPKPDAAEPLALLDGVLAKLVRDDEHGFETDLRSLRRLLTAGTWFTESATPAADEFADIREFRRRAAEMDRQDAELAAAEHDEFLRAQFPREASARDKARDAVTEFVFDALHISPGSIPEAPAPIVVDFSFHLDDDVTKKHMGATQRADDLELEARRSRKEPGLLADDRAWRRDDEKTMLRILLLSAETTGFHGNDPAVHMAKIAKWTNAECRAVDEWCVAMHHQAADSGVSVPPKPKVLVPERPAAADSDALTLIAKARGPISAEELERAVVSIIVAETRYPEHHFSHAAKRIAELLTRDSAE